MPSFIPCGLSGQRRRISLSAVRLGLPPRLLGWCAMTGDIQSPCLVAGVDYLRVDTAAFLAAGDCQAGTLCPGEYPHAARHPRCGIYPFADFAVRRFVVGGDLMLPYLTGMSGLIYLISALLLGAGIYLFCPVNAAPYRDTKTAMRTFWFSIVYITLLFAALLLDHYVKN